MNYRSLSFHESWPDPRIIRRGAELGFNDVCLQTERGLLKRIRDVRARLERSGTFELIKSLGMTVSLWVHEFADYEEEWGEPSVDNEKLWTAIAVRYDHILTELFPWVDNLVLTVVETQKKATATPILKKLTETIKARCEAHGCRLILRSFVHHPDEFADVRAAIAALPDDLTIMTKSVPQDWHMRSIDDPLIGKVAPKPQFIEVDIAGEYFRMDHVANCFTDVLERQFRFWQECGCSGISVRVDRGWKPWERLNTIFGRPQEANLWALAYLAGNKPGGVDAAWRDYCAHYFGEKAAAQIEAALRTSGNVVSEGLYVLDEPFGESKYQHTHPLCRMPQEETAVAYDDNDDKLRRNPFHMAWSVFRWDEGHVAEYQRIRRGDPDIIRRKTAAYELARGQAAQSLAELDRARDVLDPDAYRYLRFLLEENAFQLEVYCAMQFAWLKLSCILYGLAAGDEDRLRQEALAHLAAVEALQEHCRTETLVVEWQGEVLRMMRGQYVDVNAFLKEFRRYWGAETGS